MKEAVIEPRQVDAGTKKAWMTPNATGERCWRGAPVARGSLLAHQREFQPDEGVQSEVEIRFIPEGDKATRVELEHRIVAADAEDIRAAVDSPQGWGSLLDLLPGARRLNSRTIASHRADTLLEWPVTVKRALLILCARIGFNP